MKIVLLTSFILLRYLMKCDARPDGAPLSACESLIPVHGVQPSKNQPSYFVSAIPRENNKVKVIISSLTEDFQGFILQARSGKDPSKFVSGQFTVTMLPQSEELKSEKDLKESGKGQSTSKPETKTMNCFNVSKSTLTHANPIDKRAVVTEWTPDSKVDEDVVFRATVAKTWDEFWINLDSQPIKISHGAVVTKENMAIDKFYDDCFISKICFGLPLNCHIRQDCKVLLTYYGVSSGVHFSMHGYLGSQAYMAMGLSEDAIMGEDSVNECIRDESDVIARESWNEGKVNTLTKELPKSDYRSAFADGLSSCSWVKPHHFESNGKEFDFINDNYHILLATGKVAEGKLQYHKADRIPSSEALNFTIFENLKEEDESSSEKDVEPTSEIHVTTTENAGKISSSNYTEGTGRGSQLIFNNFYVIITLLLVSKICLVNLI